jgi:hemerythrin-like domain-containing protein
MSKEIKPLKRSKQLTPLSKDHHEGLLFAWKIKQGLKKGTDIKLIAQYVQWFWDNHLHDHFTEEEQILAPHLPADNELLRQMLEEHQEIEAMVHINQNIPDEILLGRLAQSIDDHIRFEERQLFPYAETLIPENDLNLIYEQLSELPNECSKWDNEFWLTKKT